jgi:RNA recognition motif-containing protein
MKRLYVGNLAPNTTAAEVEYAFSKFGRVLSVTLGEDRQSRRRGAFGYVEMEDGENDAIAGLNRTNLRGQPLTVCGAIPKGTAAAGAGAATAERVGRYPR